MPNRDRASRLKLAALAAIVALPLAVPLAVGSAEAGSKGQGATLPVMLVGNNWEGTADIVDAKTFEPLRRIDVIPDREERMAEILADPVRLGFFLGIRQLVGEGHDQFTDDVFSSKDGAVIYVSRPSFADVVAISLETEEILWRFPMEGQRSDHMGISPDGARLLVSDSTANKVHALDTATGEKTGEFPSGDSPHENGFSADGATVFHASIGRVYTPTDRPELGPARELSKGQAFFQIVDAKTLEVRKRWDMAEKLEEAGYPDMSGAVRPMAVAPGEGTVYFQVSFHHGFVEFDLESETVLRVASLPLSEEAAKTPPEAYLLDSAHHGLAMNPEGTKLCVAGTVSDYAAIVDRASFEHAIVSSGSKPYWATNGPDGETCWVSYSGDDEVAVIDYATEKEIARVPVGYHPQRVRPGVVRRVLVKSGGWRGEAEAGGADASASGCALAPQPGVPGSWRLSALGLGLAGLAGLAAARRARRASSRGPRL